MKRILTVLMAAALVFAFAMPAVATDMSVSGTYYFEGMYQDNGTFTENGTSHALAFQRMRLAPVWKVQEGLTVGARMDVMERRWGEYAVAATQAAGSDVDDNISWEQAYVDFNTGIGKFKVGYQDAGTWGTDFTDGGTSTPRIKYERGFGPVTVMAIWEKGASTNSYLGENDITNATQSDSDDETYAIAGIYKWDGGNAGLLAKYYNYASQSGATASPDLGYKVKSYLISPYFKANFGPVAVEAELDYLMGDAAKYEQSAAGREDIAADGYSYYVKATVNLGPAYVGGQFAFVSGDDPTTNDNEAGPKGGESYNPFLILYNDDVDKFMGAFGTATTIADSSYDGDELMNGYLWQVFGGISPIEKLSIFACFGGSVADDTRVNTTTTYLNDDIGYEFDVTATYKIYDNLSYMVGFGYLWTGDWFKGTDASAKIDNDYVVLHKLSVSF